MKRTIGTRIFDIVNITIILILCAMMLYPYLNQLAISFNDGRDTLLGGITIFPRVFTFENYRTIFKDPSIGSAFLISVTRTLLNVVFALFVTFSAAYAMTRKNLKGRKFFARYFCIPAYLHAGLIPTYILYRYLGLINNYWVYVVPFGFTFYTFVILRSFIQEIPEALEESALIDGANEIVVMFKIIMPLSLPALATVALWVAVGQWNDWTTTLYYITDSELFPLQYVIMRIIKQGEQVKQEALLAAMGASQSKAVTTSESVKASMLIITSVPIIMVYPFLQKYFVKGVTLGAVKG
ncbi:MAG: carbohydrate ABC transporter permease [Ruminococcaceae bacterium]|nr:carbohydrate ABC transporter permease [Oscillospiraceae bacterium]